MTTHESDPTDRTVSSPPVGALIGAIAVVALLACGGMYLYRADFSSQPVRLAFAPVPAPTYSTQKDGTPVGGFDQEPFNAFLVSVGLPKLTVPVPLIEKEACASFHAALIELQRAQDMETYGLIGMFLHYYELSGAARAAYEIAREKGSDEHRWPHYLAYLSLSEDKLEEAEKFFKLAIAKDPSYAATYMQLGRMFQQQDRNEDAVEMFEEARKLDPVNPYPHTELGNLAILNASTAKETDTLGHLYKAEKHLKEALKYRPGDQRAHSLLGRIYARTNEEQKASIHIFLAGQGVPFTDPVPDQLIIDLRAKTNALSYLEMQIDVQYELKDWPTLIASLNKMITRDPRMSWKLKLADAYLQNKNIEDAESVAQQAKRQRSDVPGPHLTLANIDFRKKDFRKCIDHCKDALERDGLSKKALALKAKCHGVFGEITEGIHASKKLIEVDRGDFMGHQLYSMMYYQAHLQMEKAGNLDKAAEALGISAQSLAQALKINPVSKDLQEKSQVIQHRIHEFVNAHPEIAAKMQAGQKPSGN